MIAHRRDGANVVIDGHSRAPAKASLERISESQQASGYRACTIPSTPATLGFAQRESEGGDAVQKSGLMPPWGETLSAREIDDLVLYLRQLCRCEAGD